MADLASAAEIAAFNAGVAAVADLARRSAAAVEKSITRKPTRFNFAAEALSALADEAAQLLLQSPSGPSKIS